MPGYALLEYWNEAGKTFLETHLPRGHWGNTWWRHCMILFCGCSMPRDVPNPVLEKL
jgi:hypothetical protein